MSDVMANLEAVRSRIEKAGGDAEQIRIVAVTKKFSRDAIKGAVAAGISDVAENYAQEARAKHEEMVVAADMQPRWHFVGQLQRNKVRLIAPFVDLWQSVDSISLIDEIARRAPNARILVQVNMSGEIDRGGCTWGEVHTLVDHARGCGLGVDGLMGVAPLVAEQVGSPEEARPSFRQLRKMTEELGLQEVSMGMTADLEVAVEEGATMLRIGSALFGERP